MLPGVGVGGGGGRWQDTIFALLSPESMTLVRFSPAVSRTPIRPHPKTNAARMARRAAARRENSQPVHLPPAPSLPTPNRTPAYTDLLPALISFHAGSQPRSLARRLSLRGSLAPPHQSPQAPLGEIVVVVVEAEIPPRSFERNGLGPHLPRAVRRDGVSAHACAWTRMDALVFLSTIFGSHPNFLDCLIPLLPSEL